MTVPASAANQAIQPAEGFIRLWGEMGTHWGVPRTMTQVHALLFIVMGMLGAAGHFVLIRAFEYAPASVLAPFVYAQLVAVLILGYLVFGAFPDAASLTGMAIIVASGIWMANHQTRAPR